VIAKPKSNKAKLGLQLLELINKYYPRNIKEHFVTQAIALGDMA